MITPHPYQTTATSNILSMLQKQPSCLLLSPISSGKTWIAANVVHTWLNKKPGDNILIIVNRITLILQTYETLDQFGDNHVIAHGALKRDIDDGPIRNIARTEMQSIFGVNDANPKILITTVETFKNIRQYMPAYTPNLIVFDEAHKATSEGYQDVRDMFPLAKILGLTATPYRGSIDEGECLYEDWYGNNIVETISIKELIAMGQLVKPHYIRHYNEDDHVCEAWNKLTEGETNKRTLVFCRDTNHAMKMLDSFQKSGIASAVITTSVDICPEATSMTVLQRNKIYKQFRDGDIDVLISIMALCEGFNEPAARFCFLLRNVGGQDQLNPAFFTQIVGRVLRPMEGKDDAYIVDFCENFGKYGPVEDWVWDITEQGTRQTKGVMNGDKILQKDWNKIQRIYITCIGCNHVYNLKEHDECIHCGSRNEIKICSSLANYHGIDIWVNSRITAKHNRWKLPARVSGLYGKYQKWATENSMTPIAVTMFGQCLTELDIAKVLKKGPPRGFKGVWYAPR